MNVVKNILFFCLAVIFISCESGFKKAKIDFNFHVKPILSDKCFACHGPDENSRKAELRLDTKEGLFRLLQDSSGHVVVPGSPERSKLFERIVSSDPDVVMPPPEFNVELSDEEAEIIKKWISEGAEWKKHWAYIKPEKSKEISEIGNPVDYYVNRKLEEQSLQPNDKADRETIIRRLYFDLIGLPPDIESIDKYLADESESATEKVIDNLFKNPAYGERMAVDWLDVARYADTHGYTVDRYRPMWRYRDWVIKAFNQNMPYDEFIKWQLAGDLIQDATKEQILATAFNRNHAQNMEGGIINEEYRSEYVADRAITFGRAFIGMTMECARCHDHKYDPVSQRNFYELYSFFNNVDEAGQISWNNATPVPTLLLPTEIQKRKIDSLSNIIVKKENELRKIAVSEKKPTVRLSDFNQYLQGYYKFEGNLNPNYGSFKGNLNFEKYVSGNEGRGVQLTGDDPLTFGDLGQFSKSEPFTISLWANIPKELNKGVIFHKGDGAILHNFRGYHLKVVEGKFEILMAHTFPYNSIHEVSEITVPREEWIHLALTYDGSSSASGFQLYLNGREVGTKVKRDNLYKDILFNGKNTITSPEPGLKIGARVRGKGFKNGVIDNLRVYNIELPEYAISKIAEVEPNFNVENTIDYNLKTSNNEWERLSAELIELKKNLSRLKENIEEIMVMDEMDEPRATYVLNRGEYNSPREQVYPGTPESILEFPEDFPQNRLGLSEWLFHPENPLPSRVIVNRLWFQFFGRGIVNTPEDFGNQGELPSHPELLDYLAVEFRESGWDIQHIIKLIVTSDAYQRDSRMTKEMGIKDPDNVYLARGPSRRMTAEMIRDNLLAVSGLINDSIGGSSVKPYQPDGLWRVNNARYRRDSSENLYRRSLYTFWKRTVPPPSMNTFDAPTRTYCVVKRQNTSTPLQALTLMNDPQNVEAGTALADRTIQHSEDSEERLVYMFRNLTSRFPNENEKTILKEMYEDFYKKAESDKLQGFLKSGEMKFKGSRELEAYSLLANTLINMDATIVIR